MKKAWSFELSNDVKSDQDAKLMDVVTYVTKSFVLIINVGEKLEYQV